MQFIIFFRDGVGEHQFQEVLQTEVQALKAAAQDIKVDYCPKITFAVVQKRHHTRLFTKVKNNPAKPSRATNVKPGTVVDTLICHPREFDFYLCSHTGEKGTSRPAHYHLLWDDVKFS